MDTNEIIKRYAPIERRFINFFIDGLIIGFLGLGVLFMIIKFEWTWIFQLMDRLDWNYQSGGFSLAVNVNFLIIYFLYYFLSELVFTTTIGKLITGTRIVSLNNNNIGFKSILVRSLTRLIPLEQLSYLSSYPVGVHDSLSNTRVILKKLRQNG